MDEVSLEIRLRVEKRYRNARWKIFVCAEQDGEECVPCSVPALIDHRCAAQERFRDGGDAPLVVWVDVAPTKGQKK